VVPNSRRRISRTKWAPLGPLSSWFCLAISSAQDFRKDGKVFSTAYGVLPDGAGLYMEGMYLPPVTTGPWTPTWSPDGREIVFSMEGSLWKIPSTGGTATQITSGPGYDSQPAWSADGANIAFSRDTGHAIQIWIMPANGGDPYVVTRTGSVNVDPHWSPDGKSILCTSSASGKGFGIWKITLASQKIEPVVQDEFQNISPSWSPDGKEIVFVSNRPWDGKETVGTGGIWKWSIGGKEPSILLPEETLWRTRPTWSPDGQKVAYISFRSGDHQLWLLNSRSGNPLQLTFFGSEVFEPAWSPDGEKIVFVSDADGTLGLWSAPAVGGAPSAIRISKLEHQEPTGQLEVVVKDAATGLNTAARVYLAAGNGKAYAPSSSFERYVTLTNEHYFHTDGRFEIDLPAGPASIEVMKGFEYLPQKQSVEIVAGKAKKIEFTLNRLADMAAQGWYSGDSHIHMNYGGNFEATPQSLLLEMDGEDLNVANGLLANWNTRIMDRRYFEGKINANSKPNRLVYFNQEYRYSFPGHLALLNLKNYVYPSDVVPASPRQALYPDLAQVLDQVHAQGGVGGLVHPFYGAGFLPRRSKEFPVLVALKKLDFYDVMCLWSDPYKSAEEWYRALNLGFKLPAGAGTDVMTNYSRMPAVGTVRVYVHSATPLGYDDWLKNLTAGRTFVTNGPLLFFKVNGQEPGSELSLPSREPEAVRVEAEARSIIPMETLDIIQNGKVIFSMRADDPHHVKLEKSLVIDRSGWLAARVTGAANLHLLMDSYVFAHTSPVYYTKAGAPTASPEDAIYFRDWINEMLPVLEQADCQKRGFLSACYDTPAQKTEVLRIWRSARDVYDGLVGK